jgi:beta-1,4-N-acetylglucosaminyltransferase
MLMIVAIFGLMLCWLARVVSLRLSYKRAAHPAGIPPVHTMAVLGSGGHTAEMLALLKTLDRSLYSPREYVIATTDHTSAQRIEAFEASENDNKSNHRLLLLPRSREVGQSYGSSVLTTLYAMMHAVVLVLRSRPSLLLCNGPGTCVPIAAAAIALRWIGIKYVTVVYVESICRVESLSLSGKLLLPFTDHFLVQWPNLVSKYPKARFIGRLC